MVSYAGAHRAQRFAVPTPWQSSASTPLRFAACSSAALPSWATSQGHGIVPHPFFKLHGWQRSWRFAHAVGPPRENGMMWSAWRRFFSATVRATLMQMAHETTPPSDMRTRMAASRQLRGNPRWPGSSASSSSGAGSNTLFQLVKRRPEGLQLRSIAFLTVPSSPTLRQLYTNAQCRLLR